MTTIVRFSSGLQTSHKRILHGQHGVVVNSMLPNDLMLCATETLGRPLVGDGPELSICRHRRRQWPWRSKTGWWSWGRWGHRCWGACSMASTSSPASSSPRASSPKNKTVKSICYTAQSHTSQYATLHTSPSSRHSGMSRASSPRASSVRASSTSASPRRAKASSANFVWGCSTVAFNCVPQNRTHCDEQLYYTTHRLNNL
jgi:hypothetical protein